MSNYNERHLADCEACQQAVSGPGRPFDDDLCHVNIRPGDDYGDLPVIQCPHEAAPGTRSKLCMGHLEAAHDEYQRVTGRTVNTG